MRILFNLNHLSESPYLTEDGNVTVSEKGYQGQVDDTHLGNIYTDEKFLVQFLEMVKEQGKKEKAEELRKAIFLSQ